MVIEVSTKSDLESLSGKSISEDVVIRNDIDFGGDEFEPIREMGGNFDGNGYKIRDFSITQLEGVEPVGFIRVSKSSIEGLNLRDISVKGRWKTGGLIGANYGDIKDCSVEGRIEGNEKTGGLVGWDDSKEAFSDSGGTIKNCEVDVCVRSTGNQIGGIVGHNRGAEIVESSVKGEVSGDKIVGGLVGFNWKSIRGCSSLDTEVEGFNMIGGLCGWCSVRDGDIVVNCSHRGKINRTEGDVDGKVMVGNIFGYPHDSRIEDCYWIELEENEYGAFGEDYENVKRIEQRQE